MTRQPHALLVIWSLLDLSAARCAPTRRGGRTSPRSLDSDSHRFPDPSSAVRYLLLDRRRARAQPGERLTRRYCKRNGSFTASGDIRQLGRWHHPKMTQVLRHHQKAFKGYPFDIISPSGKCAFSCFVSCIFFFNICKCSLSLGDTGCYLLKESSELPRLE